jgi:predicted AlkP superfamily phosphohydrolase/phosphomutase
MFYRYLDQESGGSFSGAIEDLYRRADALVGKTLRHVDKNTVLFVLSDHGFTSFRRGVNLNSWLRENGYLFLKDGLTESGRYFEGVDWSRTRAYALGLSGIYLNLKGRESSGIVEAGVEASALREELVKKLSDLPDLELGAVAIRQAYATKSLYQGPYLDAAPELIIGYNDGYRTSWDAATGKVGLRVMEDNCKAWSGDHCVDPPLVPGVLFSNRRIDADDPGIEDMAPTALELFGIDAPDWMEGKPVFRIA